MPTNPPNESGPFYVLQSPPPPLGYWQIGDGYSNIRFAMYSKPTDQQIKNTEDLLGWKWVNQ